MFVLNQTEWVKLSGSGREKVVLGDRTRFQDSGNSSWALRSSVGPAQLCVPDQGAAGWILLPCCYPWALRGSSIKRILKPFNASQGIYPLPKYQLKRQAVQCDFITHIWSGGEAWVMKAPTPPSLLPTAGIVWVVSRGLPPSGLQREWRTLSTRSVPAAERKIPWN